MNETIPTQNEAVVTKVRAEPAASAWRAWRWSQLSRDTSPETNSEKSCVLRSGCGRE